MKSRAVIARILLYTSWLVSIFLVLFPLLPVGGGLVALRTAVIARYLLVGGIAAILSVAVLAEAYFTSPQIRRLRAEKAKVKRAATYGLRGVEGKRPPGQTKPVRERPVKVKKERPARTVRQPQVRPVGEPLREDTQFSSGHPAGAAAPNVNTALPPFPVARDEEDVEEEFHQREVMRLILVGVNFYNEDGINRQDIISALNPGDTVQLVNCEYLGKAAVRADSDRGTIGFLPQNNLDEIIDAVRCNQVELSEIEDIFTAKNGKNLGVVLTVVLGDRQVRLANI